MNNPPFEPVTDPEVFRRAVQMLAIGNVAAHRAQVLNQSLGTALEAQLQAEQRAFAACGADPDFNEGLAAFFERRKASYDLG